MGCETGAVWAWAKLSGAINAAPAKPASTKCRNDRRFMKITPDFGAGIQTKDGLF